jgi:hypothetical protein
MAQTVHKKPSVPNETEGLAWAFMGRQDWLQPEMQPEILFVVIEQSPGV